MAILVEFVIGKREVGLSKEKVVEVLKGLQPEPLRGRARYYVELDGKKYKVVTFVGGEDTSITEVPTIGSRYVLMQRKVS